MIPRPALALAATVLLALSGCAVHVHDGDGTGRLESCDVRCNAGGHARVSCEKPRVPACRCEPEVVAACIAAQRARPASIL